LGATLGEGSSRTVGMDVAVVPGENGIEGTRGGMNMDATRGTPRPMWFLAGLSKTEKQRLQKLCRSELQKD
jgi:hypothetical protein